MKNRDKNKIILTISAILILFSIIITLIAYIVEKNKSEQAKENTTQTPVVSTTQAPVDTENLNTTPVEPETTEPVINSGDNKPGKYKVVTNTQPLGIRIAPEKDSSRAGSIPKGTEIEVLATYKEWAYTKYESTSGWVAMEYLQFIEAGEAPEHSIGTYNIATKNDPLNLRAKPEKYSTSKSKIEKGTQIEILTVYDDWGFVIYEDNYGWLPFEYLEAAN